MNITNVLWAFLAACSFVSWPIVGKMVQANGMWTISIVTTASATIALMLSGRELSSGKPANYALYLLVAVGAFNGIGSYFFARKTSDPTGVTSAFMVLVSVWMVVLAPILDWLLNGATPSNWQVAGFVLAPVIICLLSIR